MKKLSLLLLFSFLLIACGKEEKKEEPQKTNPAKEFKKELNKTQTIEQNVVPIDLENKGIGPIKSLKFKSIDQEMADKGATIFKQKCTACHNPTRRMIGPAMKGIYAKRSPEWVMNIMLNPTEMLKKDPIAMALLKEFNNVMMIDQNLSEEDARALAEYFRTL